MPFVISKDWLLYWIEFDKGHDPIPFIPNPRPQIVNDTTLKRAVYQFYVWLLYNEYHELIYNIKM